MTYLMPEQLAKINRKIDDLNLTHDLNFPENSILDVAAKLGSKSPTSYSRYERGKTKPSLDKFSQLLRAIDPALDPVITVA